MHVSTLTPSGKFCLRCIPEEFMHDNIYLRQIYTSLASNQGILQGMAVVSWRDFFLNLHFPRPYTCSPLILSPPSHAQQRPSRFVLTLTKNDDRQTTCMTLLYKQTTCYGVSMIRRNLLI